MWMYGEDGLTHWALTRQLPALLEQFDDRTALKDAIMFFRPSFGRRGGTVEKPRSEFGEFDAIVGTPNAVYLIEAKTRTLDNLRTNPVISLDESQMKRHRVFRAYLENWRNANTNNWAEFQRFMEAALAEFETLRFPSEDKQIAKNLRFVLGQLQDCGTTIHNLLLVFRSPNTSQDERTLTPVLHPKLVEANFRLTIIQHDVGHGFFEVSVAGE